MRTDSVAISDEGHKDIKKTIVKIYGENFYKKTIYKNKIANSQEGHECCRPTHLNLVSIENEVNDTDQIKLYKLIWQRTIASQMKSAEIKITIIQLSISKYIVEEIKPFYYFQSEIEKIIFEGFMKVYIESNDDEPDKEINRNFNGSIPKINKKLIMNQIIGKKEYLKPPTRYTQASLVKKLETLGIGRPSTFVNTIKTILDRNYVKIGNTNGIKKEIVTFTIKSENNKNIMKIFEENGTLILGEDKNKILPTDLGVNVTNYLINNFTEMMDYNFTAKMEQKLDDIANGKKIWYKVIEKFYNKLSPIINELSKKNNIFDKSSKLLGTDNDGNEIYVINTKWGPRLKKTY